MGTGGCVGCWWVSAAGGCSYGCGFGCGASGGGVLVGSETCWSNATYRNARLYAVYMARTCERCGGPVDLMKPGRIPRFCSTRCRMAAHRAAMPVELRESHRWVRWTAAKRPIRVDGSPASSTDPATWASYAQVRAHTRKGFVLGEGVGCFDLDHCLVDGVPTAAAQAFLDRCPATYVEVSPGGDGLHIWGLLPEAPGVKKMLGELSVERYSRHRFITVTGRRWPGATSRLADLSRVRL